MTVATTLAQVLSPAILRSAAGPGVYLRGEAYWRDGSVLRVTTLGDDAVEGEVAGTVRYLARLRVRGRVLHADCTCPHDAALCKHGVALGLAFLDQAQAAPAPARRSSGGPDGADAGFATEAELLAWARAHQVEHALDLPIRVLAPLAPTVPGWLFDVTRLTVRQVVLDGAVRMQPMLRGVEVALAQAARQVLATEAASVQDGLREEAARAPTPPDSGVAAAWALLLQLRAAVRADAPPRGAAARRHGRWDLHDDGEVVTWREAGVQAELVLGARRPTTQCSCRPPRRMRLDDGDAAAEVDDGGDGLGPDAARCVHVLAAIDATLDRLAAPEREAARVLASSLARPPWQRALGLISQVEGRVAAVDERGQLWWRLRQHLGELVPEPVWRRAGKRGLGRGQRADVERLLADPRPLPRRDREVAEQLLAWEVSTSRRGLAGPCRVAAALVGHPRVCGDDADSRPIEVRRSALRFDLVPVGDELRLVPGVDGHALGATEHRRYLGDGQGGVVLDLRAADGVCLVVEVGRDEADLLAVLDRYGDRFPPAAHAELLDRVAGLASRVAVEVPAALRGQQWASDPAVVVRVRLAASGGLDLTALLQLATDAPPLVPGHGRPSLTLVRNGQRGFVERDLATEEALVRRALAALPLDQADADLHEPFAYHLADPDAALALVAALAEPPPGLRAEWIERPPRVVRGVGVAALRVQVTERKDWFDVAGGLEVDGERLALAALLEAVRTQRRYVRVDDQRWLELSDSLREQLGPLAAHRQQQRGAPIVTVAAVPALSALADAGAKVSGSPAWTTLVTRMRAAATARAPAPRRLRTTLRDYQRDGHTWLHRLAGWGAGGCLADDMGLGKTVQTIAMLLDRRGLGPALVVAPTSVALNWVSELERFAPDLSPHVLADGGERAALIARLGAGDVLITTYALLARELELLRSRRFATLVFDEAQALKNASTQRAQAARQLVADFKLALSGTPLENHLGELWSLFAAVFPPLLGPWESFRAAYATPIERQRDPEAQAALSRLIRPFILRRRKHEVARELPARTEITVTVPLSAEERRLYEDVRLAAIARLEDLLPALGLDPGQGRIQVLAELTRLRLAACHPRLNDPTSAVPSAKLGRLLELVEELRAEGHRALVFSQFVRHLALVREALDAAGVSYQYLDGSTPAPRRAEQVAAFQAGQGDLFLISLKAGGLGLNLTAADYVIHLDPWWNPAVEDQASDRAHRIGQTRPVTIYRLVAAATIEDKILALHGDKRALVASVLDGTDRAAALTTDDLMALLRDGEVPPPGPAAGGPAPAAAQGRRRARRASPGPTKTPAAPGGGPAAIGPARSRRRR